MGFVLTARGFAGFLLNAPVTAGFLRDGSARPKSWNSPRSPAAPLRPRSRNVPSPQLRPQGLSGEMGLSFVSLWDCPFVPL